MHKKMFSQELVDRFHSAISEQQIYPYYQPQINHNTGRMVGAEALMRWGHPKFGLQLPSDFIPVLEAHDLIYKADLFMFEDVCKFLRKCFDQGISPVPISVNMSRCDLYLLDYVREIERIRRQYEIPVRYLRIEITETAAIDGPEQMTRVMEKLAFTGFNNKAVNGGTLSSAIAAVGYADYYTIEHGINDWGHSTPVGTIQDYINNTKNGTFAAYYRQVIDRIFQRNKKARVILCTPRKAYGFGTYLPAHWYDPLNGIYLQEYADIVRQIAAYESFPVADFFAEAGGQRQLDNWSYDTALHPNDDGMQIMANILIQAFEKILGE